MVGMTRNCSQKKDSVVEFFAILMSNRFNVIENFRFFSEFLSLHLRRKQRNVVRTKHDDKAMKCSNLRLARNPIKYESKLKAMIGIDFQLWLIL